VAVAAGLVWAANQGDATVSVIDPKKNKVVKSIDLGSSFPGFDASGFDDVWVPDFDEAGTTVTRIDGKSRKVVATITVGRQPLVVGFGAGSAWVSNYGDGSVSRIDPKTNEVVATVTLPTGGPQGLAFASGAMWVAASLSDTVYRIDPETNEVTGRIDVGAGPRTPLPVGDQLWLTTFDDHKLSRLELSD
jgi:virginiamycin B lyase